MTFRNGKKEIVQSIRTKNGLSPSIGEKNQFNQFNWTSTNIIPTDRKESKAQEKQKVTDHLSNTPGSATYPTYPSSNKFKEPVKQ